MTAATDSGETLAPAGFTLSVPRRASSFEHCCCRNDRSPHRAHVGTAFLPSSLACSRTLLLFSWEHPRVAQRALDTWPGCGL